MTVPGQDDIILSVYCATYNQEKYIKEALDSILMQQTTFKFEVLVGEDASTDGTRAVLQQYEAEHPGFLTVFYREKNMHKEPIFNALDLRMRCRGKYFISLEGDDFWTDPLKLEKQVTFLETHPEYLAVSNRCIVVGEDSKPLKERYPQCRDEEYSLAHYENDVMPGQFNTVMMRNYYKENLFDTGFVDLKIPGPGDRKVFFSLIANGKVFCMQETMNAYRHVTTGGSSYSATAQKRQDHEKNRQWYAAQLDYAYRIRKGKDVEACAELLYFLNTRAALLRRRIGLRAFFAECSVIRHPFRALRKTLTADVNRYVTKKYLKTF